MLDKWVRRQALFVRLEVYAHVEAENRNLVKLSEQAPEIRMIRGLY